MSLPGEKRSSTKFNLGAFLASTFGRAAKRYLLVGGVSALADGTIFAAMFYGFDLHYIAAGAISFSAAISASRSTGASPRPRRSAS